MVKLSNIIFLVGIYIRLSREDTDKDKKDSSESVLNQKSLLKAFVLENGYTLVDIYIDDGYSGTNYDRPAFNRMISDIENGKINMVITKDLSRLGRDYIETGKYIEKYFPSKNVRYIAITDNIDTALDNINNDIVPFKAIMNDMYAKDISKKIRTALETKMKAGKWVGGRAPFGYKVDLEDKNHLVLDEEQALIVKRMFEMASEGITPYKIAKIFTEEKIKTPAQYLNFNWMKGSFEYGIWHYRTIKLILSNQIYVGDMVQRRRSKVNYKIKKVIWNDPSKFIIVKNTHEAIIDREMFNIVQNIINKKSVKNNKKVSNIFDGLLTCYECGHRISIQAPRRKSETQYTMCNNYRSYTQKYLCTPHSNNYFKLEKVIIDEVRNICIKYMNYTNIQKKLIEYEKKENAKKDLTYQINDYERKIELLNINMDIIYMDNINGKIDDSRYRRVEKIINNDIKVIEEKKIILEKSLSNEKSVSVKEIISGFVNNLVPTREVMIKLIDRVEIHQDKTIDIYFNFKIHP